MAEVGGTEYNEFKWGKKRRIGGKKRDVQFYESFTYDGVDYTLYDNIYLYKEGESFPYLGKLIKIWETADKSKKVKVLWFFQPWEISNYIVDELAHPKEIFLATGEGEGLANINPLESINGRCNVVCISKDSRNPQPSDRDIKMADFVFYRTFDVGLRTIMDRIDEKIAGTEVKFIFNRPGFLEPSSVHNFSADDKNASENAMEINGRVILSKLNSSENQIPEDDRQEEQKPVVAEKLAPNDRQENGFNYKSASSFKVEENSDVKVPSVKHNISQREKLVSGVVTESCELAKANDRQENTSGDKTGFRRDVKENADSEVSSVKPQNSSIEKIDHINQVKVDEKLKYMKDASELDERPHKKAKLNSSVKVSNDDENSRHPTDPRWTTKKSSDKLKIDDKLTKPTNCKTPGMSPNDGKRTGDKAVEVICMPDSDRSNWFGEIPWEERMQDAHEHGKLVLFQNLDPTYSSADVQDIVWTAFKKTCRAKVVQHTAYSSPHSGQAFAIFNTREVAEGLVTELDKRCLWLPNQRPLVASIPNPCFLRKQSMFAGHLIVDKLKYLREMKEAVSTSHCSQPNTLEYDMAMEWCLMTETSNRFWKKLYEQQRKEIKRVKANFKTK
ncbi:Bromo-adjacent domain-containing protein, putative isoform 2 [Hibiscus syriacus]|uniref:Bromo-adjacent domain-containing protein, putative isoform 2 n=1 Tax=Hibiscus syriacus TaxID=106335 RepID=A0A6A3CAE0_HIBSY|nr:protein ANTI-SILENCING 1-like [Hibiscus syriacus]KAE8724478.1 Bromo-adjacent domain-containing protein, putative isoform 2 [Hibiscus syriacus]